FLADSSDVPRVIIVVNRIRFFLANDTAINEITFLGQADVNQLTLRELDQITVARIPKSVVFEAEILKAVTDLVRLRHHLGGPGSEVLDAADFHTWIVNVDPVVIEHLSIFQNQHHGEKVAVPETFGCAFSSLTNSR